MNTNIEYIKLSDEELVALYHDNDMKAADYLINKYKNLVRQKARSYYLAGADNEDLIQEGMVGLFKAIRDYTTDREANFMTFASLCISRNILSAVTRYNRKGNSPLNESVSFEEKVFGDEDCEVKVIDTLVSEEGMNPEALFIAKEQAGIFVTEIDGLLSKFEKEVLVLYREGFSYREIGIELQKSEKAIDNAIQRIRNKISKKY